MPVSLVYIQWGIIALFVVLHFLIGFLRGGSKSTYFTFVSLLMTVVTLVIVSLISVSWVVPGMISVEQIIDMVNPLVGNPITDDMKVYLLEPAVYGFIIAIADLVIRIVAYFLFYPVIKTLITLLIFKPIWKHGILPGLLTKQNVKLQEKHEAKYGDSRKYRPRKRLKKNILSRLFGGAMGAFRGAVVGVVLLIPLLVLAGFATEIHTTLNELEQSGDATVLSNNDVAAVEIPSEIETYLDQIDEMNAQGVSQIINQIMIGEQTLDRYVFDQVFTTTVADQSEEPTTINFGNELEHIIAVAGIVAGGGYLDGFDPSTLDETDIENLGLILEHVGQSQLIGYMIPTAVNFGVSNLMPDYLDGYSIADRTASLDALDQFYDIDWTAEFTRIYEIANSALTFASVEQWQAYLDDPTSLADLSAEEGVLLANIVRAFGDLEVLTMLNVAIDYVTTLNEVQQEITWIDQAEKEAYLQDQFAYILDDPNFFVGETGEFYRIAQFIEAVFTDEFGDNNLSVLIDSMNDPEALIQNQNPDWAGNLIEDLTNIKLFIESVDIGVDYAFYTQLKDQLTDDMISDIETELESVVWSDEIVNVSNIYKEALKLGVSAVFGDNPDYYAFIDEVAVDHMDSLRLIVEYVFEDSAVVNLAIEYASPMIIDQMVSDETLKDIIYETIMSDVDSGVVDFSFGQEINNILTIVETIYSFTTTSELMSMTSMDQSTLLETISHFGDLSAAEYETFRTALTSLQVLTNANSDALNYVKSLTGVDLIYVPDAVQLNEDVAVIFDIAYEVATYIGEQSVLYADYQDIDFTALFADETFRSYFLNTTDNNHSDLIFMNMVSLLDAYASDYEGSFVTMPQSLVDATYDSTEWATEVNAILGFVFDIATTVGQTPGVDLSYQGILDIIADPTALPFEAFTQFKTLSVADGVFGALDDSMIYRSSVVTAVETLGETLSSSLYGLELQVPDHMVVDGMVQEGVLSNLIYATATLVDDMNTYLGVETIEEAMGQTNTYELMNAFNQVSDDTLDIFGSADLIHGLLSEVLLNPELQVVARDLVNNMGILGLTVDDSFMALTRDGNVLGTYEFADLLKGVKALQLTPELLSDFYNQSVPYIYQLSETQIDTLFNSYLLRNIIDEVLTNDQALNGIVDYANALYDGIQATNSILGGVEPNIDHMIRSLMDLKDADGFFDTHEIKAWLMAFKELDVKTLDELNALADIQRLHEKIQTTFVVEKTFESKWLYSLVDGVFTYETTLEQIAALATSQAKSYVGVDYTFTIDDISFLADKYQIVETTGPNTGHVKVSEIKNFLLAGTRLNWTNLGLGSGTALVGNLSNELLSTGFDGQRHVDVILNSKILMGILDKVLNFEYNAYPLDEIAIGYVNSLLEGNATFAGITFTPDILHYDLSAYDENNVIRKEEFIEMIESATFIDFDTIIGINTFILMVDDGTFGELFDSKIIHSFVSNALTNEVVHQFGADKVNGAQAIFTATPDLFAVDPLMMDGDLFKVSELENILMALKALNLRESAAFSTLGIETFTSLLGRNVDSDTGEDDFDRVFGANYIYVLLDRALKIESLGNYVGDTLGSALGITITDFDTTPSAAMLADDSAQYEAIENGKIPKDEFRRIIGALDALGDISAIGLNTFTDMIDRNIDSETGDDDFDRFLSSDFIYIILARLFGNDGFGDYVGDTLAGAFGDDPITLIMDVPADALGTTGVEVDLITRVEIKDMMRSLGMLGFGGDTPIGVDTIVAMLGRNIDSETGEDDFYRFLNSKYLLDKISQLLLSEQILGLIANSRFEVVDFEMPASSMTTIGDRERMTQTEIYNLFNGLNLLNLTDFSGDVDFQLDSVTSLTDQETDDLLSSGYLYVTLDLMLKSEASISVPDDALEVSGEFTGMIKKTEIKDLLSVFTVLSIDAIEDINVNTITTADIRALLDLESNMIDQMISDAIVDNLSSVPTTAYNTEGTRILRTELYKMVDTLVILSGGVETSSITELMPIDTSTITTQTLSDIYDVDSRIIDRLTSESIIDSGISIHSLAYDDNSEVDELDQKLDIKRTEIAAMIETLTILDINISTASTIDDSKFTPTNIGLLLDLESMIIYRLISEGIIEQSLHTTESLAVVGIDSNYDPESPNSDLKISEMEALVEAMNTLGITTLNGSFAVDGVTLLQLKQTHWLGFGTNPDGDVYESSIIHRLISDAIVTNLYDSDPLNAPDGIFMTVDNLDLLPDEVSALIDALEDMGLSTLGATIDVSGITLAQLTAIHGLGLADDGGEDPYDSLIIHRLLSDAIVDSLYAGIPADAPSDAFMTVDLLDLKVDEISALIAALGTMGLTKISDEIVVDNLTINQLRDIHELGLAEDLDGDVYDSVIIHRLISSAIIDTVIVPDTGYMTGSTLDVKPIEISALIEALATMGLTKLSDPIVVDDLTINQLRDVHELGLAIDPDGNDYDSVIIHRLISTSIIDTVTIPDDAYMTGSTLDVKPLEISALIEALSTMGLTKLSDPIDVSGITLTQLRGIHGLGLADDGGTDPYDSLVIHRMLSDAIVDSLYAGVPADGPSDAFMTVDLLDLEVDEISALIEALDEMGLSKISDTIVVDALTITQLRNIHYLGLGQNPLGGDVYESTIIHRLISTSVIETVTVPDDGYMTGSTLDVKPLEISALIETLNVMGLTKLSDPIDVNGLTTATLKDIHEIGLGTDPDGDVYESLIIHRMISSAIVDSLYAGDPLNAPDGIFMTAANLDLLADEVSALIEALEEMGIGSLGTNLSISDPTVDQIRNLNYLGKAETPVVDPYDSIIVHRLLSETIGSALTVPTEAYEIGSTVDLKVDEISALIAALEEMNISSLGSSLSISNPSVTQLENLHIIGRKVGSPDVYQSYIVHSLLSDSIGSALTVPDEAYEAGSTTSLEVDEISALIAALTEMGIGSLGSSVSFSNPTVTQLENLHIIGRKVGSPDVYQSYIVHSLLSDSIGNSLTVPNEAYEAGSTTSLEVDEISALIAALTEMGIGSLGSSVSFSNPTLTQLENLHIIGRKVGSPDVYQSYIVHSLLSDSISNSLTVPDNAYEAGSTTSLEVDEISALIEALDLMGLSSLGASVSLSNPSRTLLQELHYLGLEEDPVDDPYDSYIVHRLISDSITSALTIPSDAYMTGSTDDLKVDEISGLIAAMAVMNMNTLTSGLTFSNPTTSQITALNTIGLDQPVGNVYDSYIVHRLLSDAISTGINVPTESYMVGRPDDIKPAEVNHLVGTMTLLGASSVTDFANITVADLSGLTEAQREFITEADTDGPNFIVFRFVQNLVPGSGSTRADLKLAMSFL